MSGFHNLNLIFAACPSQTRPMPSDSVSLRRALDDCIKGADHEDCSMPSLSACSSECRLLLQWRVRHWTYLGKSDGQHGLAKVAQSVLTRPNLSAPNVFMDHPIQSTMHEEGTRSEEKSYASGVDIDGAVSRLRSLSPLFLWQRGIRCDPTNVSDGNSARARRVSTEERLNTSAKRNMGSPILELQ